MKKEPVIVGVLLAGLVCGAGRAGAQTVAEQVAAELDAGKSLDWTDVKRADVGQNVLGTETDRVLNMLLSIPFEQRQYIFPALFEENDLPKKIRLHPEIAVWEGKRPTRIAPQMQAFADEYLADLNPRLYPYISPDAFPEPDDDRPMLTDQGEDVALDLRRGVYEISDKPYRAVGEWIVPRAELRDNPDYGVVSEAQIEGLGQGMAAFDTAMNEIIAGDRKSWLFLSQFYTSQHDVMVNPFQTWLGNLKRMGKGAEMDAALKQAGWADSETFARAADTVAKAYRANYMTLRIAFDVRRYRGKEATSEADKMGITVAKMYEAYPADVRQVGARCDQVREAFIKNGHQGILNAIRIDELEK